MDLTSGKFVFGEENGTSFDILFCGDFCPRNHTEPLILQGKSSEILAPIMAELRKKDLSVINLETALTRADTPIAKSGPNLKVDPQCADLLVEGGWDIACCANNHIGDYGPQEVAETLKTVNGRGIKTFGAASNLQEARKPLIVEKNGLKIAFLAYAENEFGAAKENTPGANPLNPVRNIGEIRSASDVTDITIVMVHGGNEFNPMPSPRMVDTYRAFAEAGASAVIAGHTHCPQGMEIWQGVPIVYSLSDFLFDISADKDPYKYPAWWHGYMVRVGFSDKKAFKLEVIPHHCYPHAEKVKLLEGEERVDFLNYLGHLSDLIKDESQVMRLWEAWCAKSIGGYFSKLGKSFYPVDWDNHESVGQFMGMRNLHTCEAHNELVTHTLRLIEEKRLEEAAESIPQLDLLIAGRVASTGTDAKE